MLVAFPVGLIVVVVVVVVVDILAPPDVHLGPLPVAGPPMAAAVDGGARLVGSIGALAVVAQESGARAFVTSWQDRSRSPHTRPTPDPAALLHPWW